MAALLKGQVLKHLSKLFKNLSSDKLQLSALKGFCELNNLELNEEVLMDLLEFPVWLNLSKAHCNYVAIKIQWMKLKTVPISLALDEVVVEVETLEEFRKVTGKGNANSLSTEGKYGFANRVFDGIKLSINAVTVRFTSKVFQASFQLSRLLVESRTPTWKKCADLRLTRIKDANRGQLLIFKHVEWQTMRLEAKSTTDMLQTPLRLITNQASCRITLKKNLSDSQVVNARIMLVFDDLLWVLTDAQVLSAMHFADYLNELIRRAPISKRLSEDSLDVKGTSSLESQKAAAAAQQQDAVGRLFSQYDVIETSYHLYITRIEVHLCDDLGKRSKHSSLTDGGALQITLSKLIVDLYPYHKVLASRNHWIRYLDPSSSRKTWQEQHLHEFCDRIIRQASPPDTKASIKAQMHNLLNPMLSTVSLIRLGDYSISCVMTNKSRKQTLEKLIQTDKSTFVLPEEMPNFYMEIAHYWYYNSTKPVPDPTAFVHIAPTKISIDFLTLLWVNAFHSNLHKAALKLQELLPAAEDQPKLRTRVEALMPQICYYSQFQEELVYSSLEIKTARIVAQNFPNDPALFQGLNSSLEFISGSNLFYNRESFPWLSTNEEAISSEFMQLLSNRNSDSQEQLWAINLEPFWIEFRNAKTGKLRPFIEPIPVTAWLRSSLITGKASEIMVNCEVLVSLITTPKVQLEHHQFLFLMRFLDNLNQFSVQMNEDAVHILEEEMPPLTKFSLAVAIPKAEVILILAENYQTSRSIGTNPLSSRSNSSIVGDYGGSSTQLENPAVSEIASNLTKSRSDSVLSAAKSDSSSAISSPTVTVSSHLKESNLDPAHRSLSTTALRKQIPNNITVTCDAASIKSDLDDSLIEDDVRSVRSDVSADSDQYVMLGLDTMTDDDPFNVERAEEAEEANECTEEATSSGTENGGPLAKPAAVSVLRVLLGDIHVVQKSKGFHSEILIECHNINISESIKLEYSEYEALITTRRPSADFVVNDSVAKIRIDTNSKPNHCSEMTSLVAQNVNVSLSTDTVILLTDFITDPYETKVPPVNILLSNVQARLVDNAVKIPPVVLEVPQLLIQRDNSNGMKIVPQKYVHIDILTRNLLASHHKFFDEEVAFPSEQSEDNILDQVLQENEKLLREVQRLKEENRQLSKKQ